MCAFIFLLIDNGHLFSYNSFFAISIGSYILVISTYGIAPCDICSALIPITLEYSYLDKYCDVILLFG